MWPYVGVKSSPIVSKSCPKSTQSSFSVKMRFFKIAEKETYQLGNFFEILLRRTIKKRPIWSHCRCPSLNRLGQKIIRHDRLLTVLERNALRPLESVWPDDELNSCLIFSNIAQKSSQINFFIKVVLFKIAQKFTRIFGLLL